MSCYLWFSDRLSLSACHKKHGNSQSAMKTAVGASQDSLVCGDSLTSSKLSHIFLFFTFTTLITGENTSTNISVINLPKGTCPTVGHQGAIQQHKLTCLNPATAARQFGPQNQKHFIRPLSSEGWSSRVFSI